MKYLFPLCMLIAALLVAPATVCGQDIVTACDMTYDASTNTITAQGYAYPDYGTAYYYNTYVTIEIANPNGNPVAFGNSQPGGPPETGPISVSPTQSDGTYYAYTTATGTAYFSFDPCQVNPNECIALGYDPGPYFLDEFGFQDWGAICYDDWSESYTAGNCYGYGPPSYIAQVATYYDGASYNYVSVSSCPTSVTLANTTAIPLEDYFPSLLTGVGITASMQANPNNSNYNWNGTAITEAVSWQSATPPNCDSGLNNNCTGSSVFTVGNPGYAGPNQLPATTNIFYDGHTTALSISYLNSMNLQTCTQVCAQQYTCNGTTVGNFTITRTLTKDTIQNTPVTRVAVTKQ